MARVAVRNALLPFRKRFDDSGIPRVTYSDPEVARIGLGQTEAEARGGVTYRFPFRALDRSIVEGEMEGFVKITADRRGRILGATIVGRGAGDLLMPLVLARQHGIRLSEISDTVFPYPTRAEGLRRAADIFQRKRLEGTGGKLLRKIASWMT
jgi:pyruvate/2-oxoglutarate dehydrogenase complex dihydrolipoamide dehydrogenase (E3) component